MTEDKHRNAVEALLHKRFGKNYSYRISRIARLARNILGDGKALHDFMNSADADGFYIGNNMKFILACDGVCRGYGRFSDGFFLCEERSTILHGLSRRLKKHPVILEALIDAVGGGYKNGKITVPLSWCYR